jgi:transposase
MRVRGVGYRKIAKEVGLGVGTVIRLTAQLRKRADKCPTSWRGQLT